MTQRPGYVLRITKPIRLAVQRFAFVLLVGASLVLMALSKADVNFIERARMAIADAATPALDIVSRPLAAIGGIVDETRELARLREEKDRLQEENRRLREWYAVAQHLQVENKRLRDLAHAVPDAAVTYVTARTISDAGGAFVHSVLVNSGAEDGVEKGQAVITERGLAGRVTDVGRRAARVLLLTDLNSRIPVEVEGTRERAIMAGDNTDTLRLLYLAPDAEIKAGDRIVTSGEGGAFPPAMPVGIVTSVAGGVARVRPHVDLDALEFVQVVNYGLDGILDALVSTGLDDE